MFKILLLLATFTFGLAKPAYAQVPAAGINFGELVKIGLPKWEPESTVGGIIWALLPYVFGIAGFLILLFIILGGFQILISQSDPKATAAGQQKITYAIVGFIIVFVAYWIVQLVARILNLEPIMTIFSW